MNAKMTTIGLAAAASLALAAAAMPAQATEPVPPVPGAGDSDAGPISTIPYDARGYVTLRADEKAALRKLEDKHLSELRALEDRYDQDVRALRLKQSAERESLLKSLVRR